MQSQIAERESIDDVFLVGDDDRDSQADKYLLFDIGEEVYGIPIAQVTEIIEMQKITAVPDMPEFVKGVINLRGKVNPVIDLRLRFGMEEREYDARTCIIVVNVDNTTLGIIVDTVAEVYDIEEENIDPVPNFHTEEEKNRYVSGLGKIEDRVTILIDTEKILNVEQIGTIAKQSEPTEDAVTNNGNSNSQKKKNED
jgi:purine-binding chemotaxis protein CheW